MSGGYTITVEAFNIVADGVPNNGTVPDQDFAIFVWNGRDQSSAGTASINQAVASCGDPSVGLTVSDVDLQGAGSLQVTVTTSFGDSELVALEETGSSTGVFIGSVATDSGPVDHNDGLVSVADGGTMTLTYNDADDGTGNPEIVEDSISVDCVAPTIFDVSVSNVGPFSATVTFTTDEPANGTVHVGTTCGVPTRLTRLYTDTLLTSHTIELTGLTQDTEFFFYVIAVDSAGNEDSDDNGAACFSFTTLEQPDYLTESFGPGEFDMDSQRVLYLPNGSTDFYGRCVQAITELPVDPAGGTTLVLSDDDSEFVSLAGEQISLFGVFYSGFYVGSNGYITFESPDTDFSESLGDHFAQPRVSALFDDFNPSSGGTVLWKQLADRAVVTWQGVPEYNTSNSNTFQVELFFSGEIAISYLGMAATDGIVGLSEGLGLPPGFIESDMSAGIDCN